MCVSSKLKHVFLYRGSDGDGYEDIIFQSDDEDEENFRGLDVINLVNIIHNEPDSDAMSEVFHSISDKSTPETSVTPANTGSVSSTTETSLLESDIPDLLEGEILRDGNNGKIFLRRVMKSNAQKSRHRKKRDRVYNSVHCCYYCSKLIVHIRPHMKLKHSKETTIQEIMNSDNKEFIDRCFNLLRAAGDDRHNCKVIGDGAGELLLSRRPTTAFQSKNFGPCPKCREWMMKSTIPRHQSNCQSPDQTKLTKRNLLMQSNILSGRFQATASKLLRDEVFASMQVDDISEIAQNDPLIVMLGESWLRRNISNKLKRKNYASGRMRLAAKLLKELRASAVTTAMSPDSTSKATPRTTSESPASPRTTSESPASPLTTSESPASPRTTSESPASPRTTSESPASPRTTSESPASPRTTSESATSPRTTSESATSPQILLGSAASPQTTSKSAASLPVVSPQVTSTASLIPMWDFLTPKHFDAVARAALAVSMTDYDDEEELNSPSNAIKLKYDIQRLVNAKWAYILKNEGKASVSESCRNFLDVMKIEWSDKVTRLARSILAERRLHKNSSDTIPDPNDIAKLVSYLKKELKTILKEKNRDYRKMAMIVQTRLLIYNKRRSSEIDGVT